MITSPSAIDLAQPPAPGEPISTLIADSKCISTTFTCIPFQVRSPQSPDMYIVRQAACHQSSPLGMRIGQFQHLPFKHIKAIVSKPSSLAPLNQPPLEIPKPKLAIYPNSWDPISICELPERGSPPSVTTTPHQALGSRLHSAPKRFKPP